MGRPQTQLVLNPVAPLSLLVPIAAPPQDLEDWVGQARTLVQRKMLKLDAGMRLSTPDITSCIHSLHPWHPLRSTKHSDGPIPADAGDQSFLTWARAKILPGIRGRNQMS